LNERETDQSTGEKLTFKVGWKARQHDGKNECGLRQLS
jgi:hypothetical protein